MFGPGLLGASIALAVKTRGLAERVVVWGRRPEPVAEILTRGMADEATCDVEAAARGADLLVIATPAGSVAGLARQISEGCPAQGAVLTDVASVKKSVVDQVSDALTQGEREKVSFVGSHPMAGSEKSGLEFASESLFEGRPCVLTPVDGSCADAVRLLRSFWSALGCRILTMSPKEHDRAVARISHLPHAVAAAVVKASLAGGMSPASAAGPGFRDSTRVAAGLPEMWAEILLENRDAVRESVADTVDSLRELLAILDGMEKEGLRKYLEEARELRAEALNHE